MLTQHPLFFYLDIIYGLCYNYIIKGEMTEMYCRLTNLSVPNSAPVEIMVNEMKCFYSLLREGVVSKRAYIEMPFSPDNGIEQVVSQLIEKTLRVEYLNAGTIIKSFVGEIASYSVDSLGDHVFERVNFTVTSTGG